MKKQVISRSILLAATATALVLAGCGASDTAADTTSEAAADAATETADAADSTAEASGDVTVINVGTTQNFEDVSFINESGELDGFEIELLKEVDARLPQYEFNIAQFPFDNLLISLDSGKLDIASSMFEYSDERAANYLYGEVGYRDYSKYFYGLAENGAPTWESLAGKTVGVRTQADNSGLKVEAYNEENPDKAINLDYYGDVSVEVKLEALAQGKWDAVYATLAQAETYKTEYPDYDFVVGDLITSTEAYWLYQKDNTALQQDVDAALQEIKDDGTLDELANKWFGTDAYPELESAE